MLRADVSPIPPEDAERRVESFLRKHRTALLTVLFTDIVDSIGLKHSLGDRGAIDLLERHHAAVRELLAGFPDAEEIERAGDSLLIVFVRPSDAVHFALKVQRAVRALAKSAGRRFADRIGIHVGEIFLHEGSDTPGRVAGLQVDVAARIMSLGEADQILLSRFAFDSARQALRGHDISESGELTWLDHGHYALKGLEDSVEICEVGETAFAALRVPGNSEKGQRCISPHDEPVLGWRPAAGQVVPGTHWALDRLLGSGGFGEVWLATHQTLRSQRVFKFCFEADRVRSLKREVTLFRVLRDRIGEHPGIVAVHDVFFDEAPFYIVMDYVDGPNLAEWAQENLPSATVALRLEIAAQIALALQAAHDAGVIHRDVKPSNVLVAQNGRDTPFAVACIRDRSVAAPLVKLTDFGIGNVANAEAFGDVTELGFTQTMMIAGSMTGTQLYMAPELVAGRPATVRTDIYALGVVLYQLIVGDLTRPLASDWMDDIDDPLLREDIRQCVTGDPARRFAGAAQLAENLRSLEVRREALAHERRQATMATRRRRQARYALAGAAVLAVFALGLVFALLRERELHERVASTERRANDTLEMLRETAPTFSAQAGALVEKQDFAAALEKISYAIALEPREPANHFLRGKILQSLLRIPEARDAFAQAAALDPQNRQTQENLSLCEKLEREHPNGAALAQHSIEELRQAMLRQGRNNEALALTRWIGSDTARRELLLKAWRSKLHLAGVQGHGEDWIKLAADGDLLELCLDGPQIDSLEPLRGMPLRKLSINNANVSDLSPLAKMPLEELLCDYTQVADLQPLRGLKLKRLSCEWSKIKDLAPLAGMPLVWLNAGQTAVADLSPLRGMPLEMLDVGWSAVADLAPLAGLPLRELDAGRNVSDLAPLRGMRLERLRVQGAVEDLSLLAGMPLAQFEIYSGATRQLRDISPLRGLPLKILSLRHTLVDDLSPIIGMPLEALEITRVWGPVNITDFTPLRGLRLRRIWLDEMPITDLSLLRGMPLTEANFYGSTISDLEPLRGMALESLTLDHTHVTSLDPLRGMPLRLLSAQRTKVADLAPLAGMPLEELRLEETEVVDLSVLATLPLKALALGGCARLASIRTLSQCKALEKLTVPGHIADLDFLRAMPNLRRLTDRAACVRDGEGTPRWWAERKVPRVEDFWRAYDDRTAER